MTMSKSEFRRKQPEFSIRRSQLIVPFGVGAIVNMPDVSLMACSIDLWNAKVAGEKIFDERLQKRLRVSYFLTPSSSEKYPKGLPFVYFPKWLSCPACRSFRPVDEWKRRWLAKNRVIFDVPRCDNSQECRNAKLIPSRFVIACEKGHIDDFPWIEWVHRRSGVCDKPDLSIHSGGGIAGLGGIKIYCKTCKQNENMLRAFSREAFNRFIQFRCTGNKPWLMKKEDCVEIPQTLQRGASNVYFPQIISSICIPPYSDDLNDRIIKGPVWELLSSQNEAIDDKQYEFLLDNEVRRLDESREVVDKILKRMLRASSGGRINIQSEIEYRYDEYQAFQGKVKEGTLDSKHFSIEPIDSIQYNIYGLKKVILVHRLREIRTLVSFSRINPFESEDAVFSEEEKKKIICLMPVSEKAEIDWFPAIEVNGEGIFILFDEQTVKNWANKVSIKSRIATINRRYANMCIGYGRKPRFITPEFVFLHTFAHVLIRQLSYEAGYSTASLRERIYCSADPNHFPMTGLLIYTASGDSEGSMGGLVRQGRVDKLPAIIDKAICDASWCSSDPVCIESDGQGLGSVNLAACYACLLLPETTCEKNNRFLDRATLIGTPEDSDLGFFNCK